MRTKFLRLGDEVNKLKRGLGHGAHNTAVMRFICNYCNNQGTAHRWTAPFHGLLKQERSGPVPNGRRLLFVFKIKFSINRNPSVGPSKQNRIDRWPEGKPAQWLCKSKRHSVSYDAVPCRRHYSCAGITIIRTSLMRFAPSIESTERIIYLPQF
ncbi:hypothetical protein LSTR_LSTR002842 [Laodelphax striatellus]|uniref:Uncharacterized protein n=1 Tax=Laodelphax striatellus TaxID=195883 RepID=A0A482XIR5_LAOST|nr:hypothetical protein LSTR_LSTR002842 [Laodelphax striatellus]